MYTRLRPWDYKLCAGRNYTYFCQHFISRAIRCSINVGAKDKEEGREGNAVQ